jgi:dimethylargininase
MAIAITRAIPCSFEHATMEVAASVDVELARLQHAHYVAAMRSLGLAVVELPADDTLADCCFVEDTVVVADGVALVTRPGAASRRGETAAVEAALASIAAITRIEHMDAPATLDGGDCLRIGRRMYVGLSARTNAAGVARLREVFSNLTIVPVALANVLHLKCHCSPLGDDRVLLAEATIAPETFAGLSVVMVPHAERYAANCLAFGGTALVSDGFPETRAALERAGIATVALSMSEMRKADGSLTCLSVLIEEER